MALESWLRWLAASQRRVVGPNASVAGLIRQRRNSADKAKSKGSVDHDHHHLTQQASFDVDTMVHAGCRGTAGHGLQQR
jgi:hypothetical protein